METPRVTGKALIEIEGGAKVRLLGKVEEKVDSSTSFLLETNDGVKITLGCSEKSGTAKGLYTGLKVGNIVETVIEVGEDFGKALFEDVKVVAEDHSKINLDLWDKCSELCYKNKSKEIQSMVAPPL